VASAILDKNKILIIKYNVNPMIKKIVFLVYISLSLQLHAENSSAAVTIALVDLDVLEVLDGTREHVKIIWGIKAVFLLGCHTKSLSG